MMDSVRLDDAERVELSVCGATATSLKLCGDLGDADDVLALWAGN